MNREQIVQGHATFRVLLQAMSRPGTIHGLPEVLPVQPVFQLLDAIIDNEVRVACLGQSGQEFDAFLARHTGCCICRPEEADFVVVSGGSSSGMITRAQRGRVDYPHEGATCIYLVEALFPGRTVTLTGPGILETILLGIDGLALGELALIRETNREYPLGVDVILLDSKGQCACIPRSTTIEVH